MPGSRRQPGLTSVVAGVACLMIALASCARSQAAAPPPIAVVSAVVVEVSGIEAADGYLVIQNSGPADRLTSVSSSSGGSVLLRGPGRPGAPTARAVSEITIPAHSLVRLDPSGMHLVLTHVNPRHHKPDITLTLVFAHAGTLHVTALTTNPQTDNSGYFGDE
jgi:periplasmic copper chaperone A